MEEVLLSQKCQTSIASRSKQVGAVTSSAQIEEVMEDQDSCVAGAVMPSSVLGSGSETDEEVSPLSVLHLCWECTLIGPGADEPLTVSSMLDSSAHVILIDNSLVEKL